MKKLSLNLDALSVESFATDALEDGTGTVHGLQQNTLNGAPSCFRTGCCPRTYDVSCAETCTC